MTEAWRIILSILVSDKIFILSIFVGCFYHKGQALSDHHKKINSYMSLMGFHIHLFHVIQKLGRMVPIWSIRVRVKQYVHTIPLLNRVLA